MGKQYPYRPVSTYSEERLAHKRHWDRIRQRECRSKKRKLTGELEEEILHLKERFDALEKERNELAATVKRQAEAMQRSEREAQRLRSAVEMVCTSIRDSQSTLQAALGHHGAPFSVLSPAGSTQHSDAASSTLAEVRASDYASDFDLPSEARAASDIGSLPDLSLTLQSFAHGPIEDALCTPSQVLEDGEGNGATLETTSPPTDAAMSAPWHRIPVNTAPMGSMDHGFLDLEQICRHDPAQGVPMAELKAQAFPHISNLLNPEVPSHSLQHPLSSLVIDRMMKQMPLRTTLGRLAAMWVICTLLRWRICRTPETYNAMPDFMRPNEVQLTVPHPIWTDTIVWPEARTRIIRDFDMKRYPEFRHDLNFAICVGWTRPAAEAICQGPTPGEHYLSADYVKHLSDLRNWTLPREIVQKWPVLEGAVNVRD
ncbi:hypothetical protein NLU13_3553 [Sarocladium strictum]|uniref:BZIP domain-containing protein n=1 Tax=Sarocladium strictum TaxID=5046 RepID=A0AA39GM90_SARSR|nr:hypothetical protein NLU13_3553 [Sarocladium strictum]